MSKVKIDIEEFKTKFMTKLVNPCPLCGNRDWNIPDVLYELREFNSGDLVVGGDMGVIPVVPLVCANCGNTMLINAVKIGLVPNQINL